MAPLASNSQFPRRSSRSSSVRQASAGPRALSTSSAKSSSSSFSSGGSSSYTPAGYTFTSSTPLQIKRTVNITVEISSSTATASHMDVAQYHMPVTTSCYSPTSKAYLFTPSTASSSFYDQSSACCAQGSASESEYLYEPSEDQPPNSRYQQHDTSSTQIHPDIHPERLSMLDRFLKVDSREDALVVEARAAIADGRVDDEANESVSQKLYGWETIIDGLL